MKNLDYGKDYQYAHSYEGNFVDLEFLPDDITGTTFYNPANNSTEKKIREQLKDKWKDKYDL